MTMIAGALLPDEVLLSADCRISWASAGGLRHADIAQKIVKFGDAHGVGFSGDVHTINLLLPHMFEAIKNRRSDAISVSRWLPRFLKATYRAMARQHEVRPVEFMVAGGVRNRPMRVARGILLDSIEDTRALDMTNWLAIRCWDGLTRGDDPITIPGSSCGVLYGMRSPEFEPTFCPPLGVGAIGTGHKAVNFLETYTPFIMCGRPEHAINAFVEALGAYFVEIDESTVGGMLVTLSAANGRVSSYGYSDPERSGFEIRTTWRGFAVHNTRTGVETPLRYPLEIMRMRSLPPPTSTNDAIRLGYAQERERMRSLREEMARRRERRTARTAEVEAATVVEGLAHEEWMSRPLTEAEARSGLAHLPKHIEDAASSRSDRLEQRGQSPAWFAECPCDLCQLRELAAQASGLS